MPYHQDSFILTVRYLLFLLIIDPAYTIPYFCGIT